MAKKATKNVEETKKVEKTEESTPKKKRHKGLKIFLIIFTVLIVLPIGFVFGAFFDTSTKDVKNTEVYYENLVSNVINNGLKNVEQGEFVLTIDEKIIDGVMLAGCDKINLKNFIPKMYCKIKDNNYDFYIDLQLSFFKTRAIIKTYLNEVGKEDPTLTFKIKGVTLGRLPLPMNLVTGIAGKFISDDTINSAFAQSGFHIKCEFKKLQLTYSRSTFKEDVAKYIEKLANNNQMLIATLNAFGEIANQLININYKDGVSASFDLKQLALPTDPPVPPNDSVIYHDAPINFQRLKEHRTKISEWLDKNYVIGEENGKKIYFTEDKADEMFVYLLRGYKNSETTPASELIDQIDEYKEDQTFKNVIEDYLSATYEGEFDLTSFKGSVVDNYGQFDDYSLENINNNDYSVFSYDKDNRIVTFKMSGDLINRVLAYNLKEVVGMTIPITFKENDKWEFNYIVVDNVYVGFQNDDKTNEPVMNFYIRINVAGYPITLIVDTTNIKLGGASEDDKTLGYIQFELKKDDDKHYNGVHFGELDISDKETIDGLLDSIPKTEPSVFTYDSEAGHFKIDLDTIIKSESLTEPLKTAIITALSKVQDQDLEVSENALQFNYQIPIP